MISFLSDVFSHCPAAKCCAAVLFSIATIPGCSGRTHAEEPTSTASDASVKKGGGKSEPEVFFRAVKLGKGIVNGMPKCSVEDGMIVAYLSAACVVNKQKHFTVWDALIPSKQLYSSGPPSDDGIVNIPITVYEPVALHLEAAEYPGRYLLVRFQGKCGQEPASGEMKCRVPN